MPGRRGFWSTRLTVLPTLLAQLRLALRLMREPGVPLLTRALPLLAAVYLENARPIRRRPVISSSNA
jgi:hypothetical protein